MIQQVIERIRQPIDRAISRVVNFVVDRAAWLVGRIRQGARNVRDRIISWWRLRRGFKATDGSDHHVFFRGGRNNPKLMVDRIEFYQNNKWKMNRSVFFTRTFSIPYPPFANNGPMTWSIRSGSLSDLRQLNISNSRTITYEEIQSATMRPIFEIVERLRAAGMRSYSGFLSRIDTVTGNFGDSNRNILKTLFSKMNAEGRLR
jgi:hypothetical protein